MNDCFYFGCWKRAGHFLHDERGYPIYQLPKDFPLSPHGLDSTFLPPNQPQTEGLATFVHINGWSIIAFWDRSIDERFGCNSVFLVRGLHSFDEAVNRSKQTFPQIWQRFKFPIIRREP